MTKSKEAGSSESESRTIADVPTEDLRARVAQIEKLLDRAEEILDDGVELDDAARSHAQRIRGVDEKDALTGVLDFADSIPEAFKGLANRDAGKDPKKFETELLRHRLENALLLSQLLERFDEVRLLISDSALYVSSLVKPVVLAAYEIAKPLAKVDEKDGQKLNPATNYYGGIARAGAKTRRAKKK